MARQYIDPQEYLDKIAALEKENAALINAGAKPTPEPSQELAEVTAERDALKVENAELQQKLDSAIAALPKDAPDQSEAPESKPE